MLCFVIKIVLSLTAVIKIGLPSTAVIHKLFLLSSNNLNNIFYYRKLKI